MKIYKKIANLNLTVTRLTGELAEMFAKRKSLEDEIRKRLGAIGYDF